MNIVTESLQRKAWSALTGKLFSLNGFANKAEFEQSFAGLGQVRGFGDVAYVCRRDASEDFSPDNIVLINVEDESDADRVIAPAIELGE